MDFAERFELLEKLGSGSFATVYRARDLELGREVAVKQIHAQYLEDAEQLDRYWQEAQLLASLQHPNIVTIYDIDRARGWLILEMMQSNLAKRTQGRPMDLRALKTTVAHGLRALKYLHARGIIHGDVKPSNLMVDHRRRVKLGDFGLARRASDEDGSLLKGTTRYMAPEVVSDEFGEVGPSSDLYSLGFAAYDLMCGTNFESLFPGLSAFGRNKQVAWMMWHAASDRRLPEVDRVLQGVPPELSRVINRLINKDQSKRYESAEQALDELGVDQRSVRMVSAPGVPGESESESESTAGSEEKRRLIIAASAFSLSLILSLAVLFWPDSTVSVSEDTILVRYIAAVDAETGQLKVEDAEKTFAERISLGKRPRIRLVNTGTNILFDELQAGDRLEVEERPGPNGEPVNFVTVTRPESDSGTIRSIDRKTNELIIAVESGTHRDDIVVRVLTGTEIVVNEQKNRSVAELNEGDTVEAWHLPDLDDNSRRVLTRIEARHRVQQMAVFESMPSAGRIQVRLGTDESGPISTLDLSEQLQVFSRGKPVGTDRLLEITRGTQVMLTIDTRVHRIEIQPARTE